MDQMLLPGLGAMPTPYEGAFIRLARRWYDGSAAVAHDHPLPRIMDELALSAVLLAREYGKSFTNAAWRQAEANIVLAEKRAESLSWADSLPWRIAVSAHSLEPALCSGLNDLVCNLSHHNSSLRIWSMELAWMVQPWLERNTALPHLLKNVADTLSGVDMAWALAGTFFDSEEQVNAAASSWQPLDYAEQYAERVALFKESGRLSAQAYFWKMEAGCRRLIAEAVVVTYGAEQKIAIVLQPKFPSPERSKHPVCFVKDEEGVIDIGWCDGVLSDGRSFRAEMWAQDQVSSLTIFFSNIGLEALDDETMKQFVQNEGLVTFADSKRTFCAALKHTDYAGNEFWSVNIVVGDDENTFISNSVPILPYSRSGEPNTIFNPVQIKAAQFRKRDSAEKGNGDPKDYETDDPSVQSMNLANKKSIDEYMAKWATARNSKTTPTAG